eukprot:3997873-Amphidinium_carterae.2
MQQELIAQHSLNYGQIVALDERAVRFVEKNYFCGGILNLPLFHYLVLTVQCSNVYVMRFARVHLSKILSNRYEYFLHMLSATQWQKLECTMKDGDCLPGAHGSGACLAAESPCRSNGQEDS